MDRSIWVGFDKREAAAFAVTKYSIKRHMTLPLPVRGLVLSDLQAKGLYRRPMEIRDGQMWDTISGAPQSTEHANARWLVPHLAGEGWAMFCDGDMLARSNLVRIFDDLDPAKAVYCVKHHHEPADDLKMDHQIQTRYARKNWSSLVVFNVEHPSNRALTLDLINTVPGRMLHRFCWLEDHDIGELDQSWNWLAGVSDPSIDPKIVHFTNGTPDMPGYENAPFAAEWRAELARWAA